MKTSILLVLILCFSISVYAQSPNFVELINGERYIGKIEVQYPFLKKSRIILNDTTTILLERVQKYQSADGYFVRMNEGYGDTFAKRIEKGNIDLFTRLVQYPNTSSPVFSTGGNVGVGVGFSPAQSVQYFSKDDGPLLKANARNLKRELVDNPVSMSYLKKRDGLTAVQVIGIIGGVAIGTASILSQSDKEVVDPTGMVVGLVVVTGSSWIPHFAKRDLTQKAIREYNHPGLPMNQAAVH